VSFLQMATQPNAVDVDEDAKRQAEHVLGRGRAEGRKLFRQKKLQAAISELEVSIDATVKVLGRQHIHILDANEELAGYYYRGFIHLAIRLYREILSLRERLHGDDNPKVIRTRRHLAKALSAVHFYEEAEQLIMTNIELDASDVNDDELLILRRVYFERKHYDAALEKFHQILQDKESALGDTHFYTVESRHCLALAQYELRLYEEARDNARTNLLILKNALQRNPPQQARDKNLELENMCNEALNEEIDQVVGLPKQKEDIDYRWTRDGLDGATIDTSFGGTESSPCEKSAFLTPPSGDQKDRLKPGPLDSALASLSVPSPNPARRRPISVPSAKFENAEGSANKSNHRPPETRHRKAISVPESFTLTGSNKSSSTGDYFHLPTVPIPGKRRPSLLTPPSYHLSKRDTRPKKDIHFDTDHDVMGITDRSYPKSIRQMMHRPNAESPYPVLEPARKNEATVASLNDRIGTQPEFDFNDTMGVASTVSHSKDLHASELADDEDAASGAVEEDVYDGHIGDSYPVPERLAISLPADSHHELTDSLLAGKFVDMSASAYQGLKGLFRSNSRKVMPGGKFANTKQSRPHIGSFLNSQTVYNPSQDSLPSDQISSTSPTQPHGPYDHSKWLDAKEHEPYDVSM
jgi:tetratricopeptide (TPR) repeat protein